MSTDTTLERGFGAGGYGEDGYGSPFSDELALQATASLNTTAREVQLRVWGTALDRMTVTDLWTDWVVADYQSAGGTLTDGVEDEGSVTLQWAETATDIEPTFTFVVPERYIGGEYVFAVSGSDDTESITATVSINLDG